MSVPSGKSELRPGRLRLHRRVPGDPAADVPTTCTAIAVASVVSTASANSVAGASVVATAATCCRKECQQTKPLRLAQRAPPFHSLPVRRWRALAVHMAPADDRLAPQLLPSPKA